MKTGPRYSIIPALAVTDLRLSPAALRVLCVLGTHTDQQGWCHPSYGEIAKESGLHRSTVINALKLLVETAYVETSRRYRQNGSDTSNQYRVRHDRSDEEIASILLRERGSEEPTPPGVAENDSLKGSGKTTPPVAQNDPRGSRQDDPPVRDKSLTSNDPRKNGFVALWATYPHSPLKSRRKKPPALKAYDKAIRSGVDHDAILRGAKAFAASEEARREGGEFTPMLATWINQAGWEAWIEDAGSDPLHDDDWWRSALGCKGPWHPNWPKRSRAPPHILQELEREDLFNGGGT
jgi:hypothetical protein